MTQGLGKLAGDISQAVGSAAQTAGLTHKGQIPVSFEVLECKITATPGGLPPCAKPLLAFTRVGQDYSSRVKAPRGEHCLFSAVGAPIPCASAISMSMNRGDFWKLECFNDQVNDVFWGCSAPFALENGTFTVAIQGGKASTCVLF